MTTDITRRRLLGGGAAAGLLALAGCSASTPFVGRRVEDSETIALEGAETLTIESEAGDVTVSGEDRDDVHLDIVKQSSSIRADLDDLTLESERVDDRLEVRSTWDGSAGLFSSRPSMAIDAAVPRTLALDRIETSVGRIDVRDVAGDVTAATDTGRVDVRNLDGTLAARTSTGRVDVAGVNGAVTADTNTGRITIRDVGTIGDVTATTGRIEADVPSIDGDTLISASTGRITAAVSPELDAELEVRTNTGRIDVDELEMDEATVRDDRVTATLGDGGPTLRVETSTGRITLTPLE
ncbi:DUF4097 domain-containing protein [Halosolutus amylolyticus]|uniref:DUF4097 domain-containing protein n=1 Tax=Halosolutus amylolyticus TaxID=2932267 RepID=A0ABD5PR32_9EURY|nr:DUF4097 family beta strand repeat-containing protein [Halosolutus amylolyticus]